LHPLMMIPPDEKDKDGRSLLFLWISKQKKYVNTNIKIPEEVEHAIWKVTLTWKTLEELLQRYILSGHLLLVHRLITNNMNRDSKLIFSDYDEFPGTRQSRLMFLGWIFLGIECIDDWVLFLGTNQSLSLSLSLSSGLSQFESKLHILHGWFLW
jgi:hypothetical protein